QAVTETVNSLGKRGDDLQAAGVVTDAHDGSVLAVVGSKIPGDQGFNRALDSQRPIGSTIKPFVYLVALTDPSRWNLATALDDGPISMRMQNGTLWEPHNDDNQSHGMVPMIGALDLSPLQVAQLYEYIASDGHALPLLAVRGVVDGNGRTIKRYEVQSG